MSRIHVSLFAALSLVGCTSYPPTPNATVNVQDITVAILNELYCTTQDLRRHDPEQDQTKASYLAARDGWIVGLELSLSAAIEGSVSPSISLLGPFNLAKSVPTLPSAGSTGSFTAALGGSFDQTRTNAADYKIYVDLNTLMDRWTDPHCDHVNQGGTYLEGHLGLTAWLEPTFLTQKTTRQFAPPPTLPTVTNVAPQRQAIGQTVTLTGTGLTGASEIHFGQVLATTITPSGNAATADTKISAVVPIPQEKTLKVHVTVTAPGGTSAAGSMDEFNYPGPGNEEAQVAAAPMTAGGSSGNQTPTIGSTFTFTIKSTGSIGPGFTLSRVSGGGNSLFSLIRTDTNYANIVLTPTSYCSVSGRACVKSSTSQKDARTIIDNQFLNMSLNRLAPLGQ